MTVLLGSQLDFPVHTLLKIPRHLLAAAHIIYRNLVLEIIARSNIVFSRLTADVAANVPEPPSD